jgi:hypothetical protein
MIKSLGIELEGGIDSPQMRIVSRWIRKNDLEDYFIKKSDGSVTVSGMDIDNVELCFWHEDVDMVKAFLKVCYDNGFTANSTCGFHVHLKAQNTREMVELFSFKKIQDMFLEEYKKHIAEMPPEQKSKYQRRLTNSYCKAAYSESNVISALKNGGSDRYRAINLNAFRNHRTMEIRLLPFQKDYSEAADSIDWLTTTINSILDVKKAKLKTSKIEIK